MLYTKVMKEVRYIRTSEDRGKILKACHIETLSPFPWRKIVRT